MADGSNTPSSPTHTLTDVELRSLVLALAPLAALDSIAGLRARCRDPREHPATGGDQRDAAAALDAASDAGALAAARAAWERYLRLSPDAQRTAWWIAQRGGAVRQGALVDVAEWAEVYGRLDGPVGVRERAAIWRDRATLADTRLRALKRRARSGLTQELAREIDEARVAAEQATHAQQHERARLFAWATARLEGLAAEWRGS